MPADFSRLPALIKNQVAEKMTMTSLVHFGRSSPVASSVVQRSVFSIPENVKKLVFSNSYKNIAVKFVADRSEERTEYFITTKLPKILIENQHLVIKLRCHDDFSKRLMVFFLINKTKNNKLELSYHCNDSWYNISVDGFHDLLKAADVTELCSKRVIEPDYIKNLPEKIYKIEVDSPVEDDDLIDIKVVDITIAGSSIGNRGLNNILKQWCEGERKIRSIYLQTDKKLSHRHILNGIHHEATEDSSRFTLSNGDQILDCVIDVQGYFNVAMRMEDW